MSTNDINLRQEEFGPYFQGSRLIGVEDDEEVGWLKLTFDNGFEWHIPTTDDGFVIVHTKLDESGEEKEVKAPCGHPAKYLKYDKPTKTIRCQRCVNPVPFVITEAEAQMDKGREEKG